MSTDEDFFGNKDLESLNAWAKSRALRIEVSRMSRSLPTEEKFRLTDQLIRSSRSVSANLAEGYGRYHFIDAAKFCSNARGSLTELLDHLYVCKDEEFISEEQFVQIKEKVVDCKKTINGYMKFLRSKSKNK
ncbi:MAG: four helix bundle protein [Flavobacteriales bacterium]